MGPMGLMGKGVQNELGWCPKRRKGFLCVFVSLWLKTVQNELTGVQNVRGVRFVRHVRGQFF